MYWIAFERDAYDGSGPPDGPVFTTRPINQTVPRDAHQTVHKCWNGAYRFHSIARASRGRPALGATSFKVAGTPHAISDALQTWSFKPAPNYYGRVVIDASVERREERDGILG